LRCRRTAPAPGLDIELLVLGLFPSGVGLEPIGARRILVCLVLALRRGGHRRLACNGGHENGNGECAGGGHKDTLQHGDLLEFLRALRSSSIRSKHRPQGRGPVEPLGVGESTLNLTVPLGMTEGDRVGLYRYSTLPY